MNGHWVLFQKLRKLSMSFGQEDFPPLLLLLSFSYQLYITSSYLSFIEFPLGSVSSHISVSVIFWHWPNPFYLLVVCRATRIYWIWCIRTGPLNSSISFDCKLHLFSSYVLCLCLSLSLSLLHKETTPLRTRSSFLFNLFDYFLTSWICSTKKDSQNVLI
jgi:hypothetical protein